MHIERRGVIFERSTAQAAFACDAEFAEHGLGRLDPPRCACRHRAQYGIDLALEGGFGRGRTSCGGWRRAVTAPYAASPTEPSHMGRLGLDRRSSISAVVGRAAAASA